jgi:hypothetical protein
MGGEDQLVYVYRSDANFIMLRICLFAVKVVAILIRRLGAMLDSEPQRKQVCRAWHVASKVKFLVLGIRGSQGEDPSWRNRRQARQDEGNKHYSSKAWTNEEPTLQSKEEMPETLGLNGRRF